jgi:hypothetical protein
MLGRGVGSGVTVGSGVSGGLVGDTVATLTVRGCCVGSDVDGAVDATTPDKSFSASCWQETSEPNMQTNRIKRERTAPRFMTPPFVSTIFKNE